MNISHLLYKTMVDQGMKIYPDTFDTIKEAVALDNVHFLNDKNGKCAGFVTWFIEGDLVGVTSLVVLKKGEVDLFHLRSFFRNKYPEYRFRFLNDKKNKHFDIPKGDRYGRK